MATFGKGAAVLGKGSIGYHILKNEQQFENRLTLPYNGVGLAGVGFSKRAGIIHC